MRVVVPVPIWLSERLPVRIGLKSRFESVWLKTTWWPVPVPVPIPSEVVIVPPAAPSPIWSVELVPESWMPMALMLPESATRRVLFDPLSPTVALARFKTEPAPSTLTRLLSEPTPWPMKVLPEMVTFAPLEMARVLFEPRLPTRRVPALVHLEPLPETVAVLFEEVTSWPIREFLLTSDAPFRMERLFSEPPLPI